MNHPRLSRWLAAHSVVVKLIFVSMKIAVPFSELSHGFSVISEKFAHLIIMVTFRLCCCLQCIADSDRTIYDARIGYGEYALYTVAAQCTVYTVHITQWTFEVGLQQEVIVIVTAHRSRYFCYPISTERTSHRRSAFLVLEIHAYLQFIGHGRLFGALPRRTDVIMLYGYCRNVCARNNNWCFAWPHFAFRKKSIGPNVITYLADKCKASPVHVFIYRNCVVCLRIRVSLTYSITHRAHSTINGTKSEQKYLF